MNKQEIFDKIIKLKGVTQEELNEKFSEFSNDFEEMGIPSDYIERKALFRLTTFYTKRGSSAMYQGVFLGVSNVTDFGAQKFYDAIKSTYDSGSAELKQSMIEKQQVNMNGEPLWHDSEIQNIPKFRYQDDEGNMLPADKRKINPKNELRANAVGVFTKKDSEQFFPVFVNIIAEATEKEIPLFKQIEIPMSGNKQTEDGIKLLNFRKGEAELTDVKAYDYEDICSIADKFFSKYTIDSEDELASWALDNPSSRVVFIKKAMIETAEPIIGEGKVGALRIGSLESIFDNVESDDVGFGGYTVFTPAGYNQLTDGTTDVFLVCRPQVRDDQITLSLMGAMPKWEVETVSLSETTPESFNEVEENGNTEQELNPEPESRGKLV